jgi:predicted amidohydrolase
MAGAHQLCRSRGKEICVEKLIVACVQQRLRLPQSREAYRDDLRRFLRIAANKRARLAIFPELAGTMVGVPLLDDAQSNLLKRADLARRRQATLWQKVTGTLAGSAARLLKADLRRTIAALLDGAGSQVWDAYLDLFGGLAREFDLTLVAPSAYLPDPRDGQIRNLAAVFGPQGELLGQHAKVMLHPQDQDMARPGSGWDVIQTEVGRLGLMLGSDVLFPEVGRLLAYQGAEFLVAQGACTNRVLYEKLRSGMLARMQDNQLFGAISFVVGHNEFGQGRRQPFVGRSAILAPQELTPRYGGVLVEMTNHRSESVLSAEWDFPALRDLWDSSDTPVRQALPLEQAGQILAQLYQRLQSLPNRPELMELPAPDDSEWESLPTLPKPAPERVANQESAHGLDELTVVATVSARWPLHDSVEAGHSGDRGDGGDSGDSTPADPMPASFYADSQRQADQLEEAERETGPEDETQEMDALLGPADDADPAEGLDGAETTERREDQGHG